MEQYFGFKNQPGEGCIYKIKNKINGKIYIGQTTQKYPSKRWSQHKYASLENKTNYAINYAIRKYQPENFEFKIILHKIPIEKLDFYEELWIKKFNSLIPNGYNILAGRKAYEGESEYNYKKPSPLKGIPLSEETKEKIRKSFTPERRELYSKRFSGKGNPMYGKTPAPNSCVFLDQKGENNPFWHHQHSNETKQKIRDYQKKNSKNIIMCDKETGNSLMEFESIKEATRWIANNTNFKKPDHTFISRCAKGRHKAAYGYGWKFKD